MYTLEVIPDKLNIRSSPEADPRFENWVGELSRGAVFNAVRVVKGQPCEGSDDWYADSFSAGSRFVAASQVKMLDPQWMTALKIREIWDDYGEFGELARVAVLDTGYDVHNEDLRPAIEAEGVFNKSNTGAAIEIDDGDGHGSHCASIIGGRNARNVTGIAPRCRLFIGKVSSTGGIKRWSFLVDAVNWAISQQVDVISISYGGESRDPGLESAIRTACGQHNIVVLASIGDNVAGSANLPCYPAMFGECIAVGATDSEGQISAVTTMDGKIAIYAPGEDITAYNSGGGIVPLTGTSQATAIVAGIVALIISRLKQQQRPYTVVSVLNMLTAAATPIPGRPGCKLISPKNIFLSNNL